MNVSPILYISSLGMISVAIISILWIVSKDVALSFLLLGGLAWSIAVILKFAWASRFNKPFIKFFEKKIPKLSGLITWNYIGLLTGIFECGIVLLFVWKVPLLNQASWINALAFGIGFGAIEVLAIGLFHVIQISRYIFKPKSVPKIEQRKITIHTLLAIPAPIVERIFVLFIHIFTVVLVVLSVQQSNYILFWYSFVFKSLVDAIAAWSVMKRNVRSLGKIHELWIMEFIIVILGIISLFGLWALHRIFY